MRRQEDHLILSSGRQHFTDKIKIMGIITVLWEKWVEFRRDFYKITVAAMISPLMYLIIFGLGIRTTSHGQGSFSAIAQNMSVQRLYEKALDQVMVSPTPLWQFILGQVIGGSLRGLYAALVILVLTIPVRHGLIFNWLSFTVMILNGMVFATLALVLSFLAKTYSDAPRFNTYIIMPMSFLCNTFFSTEEMPDGFRQLIEIMPLSQASGMIRSISCGQTPDLTGIVILLAYLLILGGISVFFIYRKKNL